MAWPARRYFDGLIRDLGDFLRDVRVTRLEIGSERALIDVEGMWGEHRIILSEIHRPDGSSRYAYYILDSENRLVAGFDNSSDVQAIKMQYDTDWRQHLHEEIPHRHDGQKNMRLTDKIDASRFLAWLQTNFPSKTVQ
ncbi:MAG: hypothetical protein KF753_11615 [Caldilineaceae bacterium]|nr:hypothetical protein [Caldilineaceae bacterium]